MMMNNYQPRICSLLLLVVLLGTNFSFATVTAMAMTEKEEIEIGKQGHQAILQKYRVYNNPGLQKYVSFIGNKLAAVSDRPNLEYSFYYWIVTKSMPSHYPVDTSI
jgi:predicted Zn-dependent protease